MIFFWRIGHAETEPLYTKRHGNFITRVNSQEVQFCKNPVQACEHNNLGVYLHKSFISPLGKFFDNFLSVSI